MCFTVHDVETSLPLLAGARALMAPHVSPHAAAATAAAAAVTVTSLPPLQPRSATTGSTDIVFPLQVILYPGTSFAGGTYFQKYANQQSLLTENIGSF